MNRMKRKYNLKIFPLGKTDFTTKAKSPQQEIIAHKEIISYLYLILSRMHIVKSHVM